MEILTVKDLLALILEQLGGDGLCDADGCCECTLGDLANDQCLFFKDCVPAKNNPERAKAEGCEHWLEPMPIVSCQIVSGLSYLGRYKSVSREKAVR